MLDKCHICLAADPEGAQNQWAQCNGCERWFHAQCMLQKNSKRFLFTKNGKQTAYSELKTSGLNTAGTLPCCACNDCGVCGEDRAAAEHGTSVYDYVSDRWNHLSCIKAAILEKSQNLMPKHRTGVPVTYRFNK